MEKTTKKAENLFLAPKFLKINICRSNIFTGFVFFGNSVDRSPTLMKSEANGA